MHLASVRGTDQCGNVLDVLPGLSGNNQGAQQQAIAVGQVAVSVSYGANPDVIGVLPDIRVVFHVGHHTQLSHLDQHQRSPGFLSPLLGG